MPPFVPEPASRGRPLATELYQQERRIYEFIQLLIYNNADLWIPVILKFLIVAQRSNESHVFWVDV